MAKIMFNEQYGLQQAVMDGTKTMTRRIVKCPKKFKDYEGEWCDDGDGRELGQLRLPHLPYEVGDVVAIAQRYEDLRYHLSAMERCKINPFGSPRDVPGWKNKMFVCEEFMRHHIQITDLRFERLQDITDEECLKEGVIKWMDGYIVTGIMEGRNESRHNKCFDSPCEAFAALIDRISGKGTWKDNPWVVAYSFKKVD